MIKFLVLIFVLFSISGCSEFKKGVGFDKDVPNEFLIKKIDPITKPPNYDLLPPDSKTKKKKNKITAVNETKSIIDSSLNSNSEKKEINQNTLKKSSVEKSIIDQLERND
ncbi:MAG: hypothetical protein CMJ02_00870 [Pelagibacteraceae bacterium]|jgi:predicted small lipoprotein YifL|nr:hypothetical protein [Pelagibacteraceae bacterium]OUV89419.1 MAG: hypothetical protein CBD06_00935 [Pelagibacteraceae bacterium TMED146]RZO91531.1 MAG: DUF3035 domain-containing protein [alpha proteobacterium HIMB114]|tara:strand:- start:13270 stop:13599 length:330 start_codon:yes stop_codon:yes gene_type:complete